MLGRLDIEARTILLLSLLIQAVGFVFLLGRFLMVLDSAGSAAWHALFHAASGFHNAGFDVTEALPACSSTEMTLGSSSQSQRCR